METEKSAYFVSFHYRVKLIFEKTFPSPSVFFWDSTYAVVTVIWADICVWKAHVLLGSVSSLKILLPPFLAKGNENWGSLAVTQPNCLSLHCVVQWSKVWVMGRRLLLNQNLTMDHRNHPNNTVSGFSAPLKNTSAKGKCVRSIFFCLFLTWWKVML